MLPFTRRIGGKRVEFQLNHYSWKQLDLDRLGTLLLSTNGEPIPDRLTSCADVDELVDALEDLEFFVAVLLAPARATLITDRHRSLPLWWTEDSERLLVTDQLRAASIGRPLSRAGCIQFRHFMYTLGNATLFDGVGATGAGDCVIIGADSIISRPRIQSPIRRGDLISSAEVAGEQFNEAVRTAIADALEQFADSRIVIPLSGGADSRLLLSEFVATGAKDRIVTFTYGTKKSSEVRSSQAVADALGVRWHCVNLEARQVAKQWTRSEGATFIENVWCGTSLPHIQDWYAIHSLLQHGIIEPGDCIVPGHSAPLTLHFAQTVLHDSTSPEDLAKLLIAWHGKAQGASPERLRQVSAISDPIRSFLATRELSSPQAREAAVQEFHLRERQAKYIRNSLKTYSHLGLAATMPLLRRNVKELYDSLSLELTQDKSWYHAMVDRSTARSALPGRSAPPLWRAANSLGRAQSPVRAALAHTGLLNGANAAYRRVNALHHPMAFQGFAANARLRYTGSVLRGALPTGAFADLMLRDIWHPDFTLHSGSALPVDAPE